MHFDHLKYLFLDLAIVISKFLKCQNAGMDDAHNQFESHLFVWYVHLGVANILIDEKLDQLI